jgi:hypothetical protein
MELVLAAQPHNGHLPSWALILILVPGVAVTIWSMWFTFTGRRAG